MTIDLWNIRDVFFAMEDSERLFDRQLEDGTYYWDLIRLGLFSHLHAKHGGSQADPLAPQQPSVTARAKDLLRGTLNQLTRRYLRARRPEYIFITNQRIRRGSVLVDNIADHLLDLVADRAAAFEIINPQSISYWRLLTRRPTRLPLPSLRSVPRVDDFGPVYEHISAVVARHFGDTLSPGDLNPEPIATFRQYRRYFAALFTDYRPRAVVVHNNGMFKGLFAAARDVRVPTVELQHGASCANNIFWSYPPTIPSSAPGVYVPTGYLTFSDYWAGNTHYPVRTTRTIGNDFFDESPTPGEDNHLVVISAHMFHEDLARLVLDLASRFPDKTIYYKLHPHQYKDNPAITATFRRNGNVVVVSDEMEISELFRRCSFVIGVHSTLLYAALQAGKRVCIYKRYHYFWHRDIFEYTEQFDNLAELAKILDHTGEYFRRLAGRPVLFEAFNAERFIRVLGSIGQSL